MPVPRTPETATKTVVSFREMAELLRLSRSRLYQLIDQGVFEPPIFDVRTKRPFFPEEVQRRNLLCRQTNTTANGGFYCFNRIRVPETQPNPAPRSSRRTSSTPEVHAELLAELNALGVTSTAQQVTEAVRQLYPAGTQSVDGSEVLRAVYRSLRRSST